MAGDLRILSPGLRRLQSDFLKMSKDLASDLRESIRDAAEPVRADAQRLFSDVNPSSAAGFQTKVRLKETVVQQTKPRVTGKRGDYGRRQMMHALLPALARNRKEVERRLLGMLDSLFARNGFR